MGSRSACGPQVSRQDVGLEPGVLDVGSLVPSASFSSSRSQRRRCCSNCCCACWTLWNVAGRGPFGPRFLRARRNVHSREREVHSRHGRFVSHRTLRRAHPSQELETLIADCYSNTPWRAATAQWTRHPSFNDARRMAGPRVMTCIAASITIAAGSAPFAGDRSWRRSNPWPLRWRACRRVCLIGPASALLAATARSRGEADKNEAGLTTDDWRTRSGLQGPALFH